MSDRALQDVVIRAVADAPFRASSSWRRRKLADLERIERFGRFIARHFYFGRILHFFRYSRSLTSVIGRSAEEIVRDEGFDRLLCDVVVGSRKSARRVASLASDHVASAPGAHRVGYLSDLLRYESTMMVTEAGPRNWSASSTGRIDWSGDVRVDPGTKVVHFDYDLPPVLPLLRVPRAEPPSAPKRTGALLFTRSVLGRVTVTRPPAIMLDVLGSIGHGGTFDELARRTGLKEDLLRPVLAELVDLGAVGFPSRT